MLHVVIKKHRALQGEIYATSKFPIDVTPRRRAHILSTTWTYMLNLQTLV